MPAALEVEVEVAVVLVLALALVLVLVEMPVAVAVEETSGPPRNGAECVQKSCSAGPVYCCNKLENVRTLSAAPALRLLTRTAHTVEECGQAHHPDPGPPRRRRREPDRPCVRTFPLCRAAIRVLIVYQRPELLAHLGHRRRRQQLLGADGVLRQDLPGSCLSYSATPTVTHLSSTEWPGQHWLLSHQRWPLSLRSSAWRFNSAQVHVRFFTGMLYAPTEVYTFRAQLLQCSHLAYAVTAMRDDRVSLR